MRFLTRQKVGLHRLVLLFIGSSLCLMSLPMQARAATGVITDDANVLDIAAIQQYTDPFSFTVDVFTTRVFQGSNDDFDASVKGLTNYDTTPTVYPCDPKYQVGCQHFHVVSMPEEIGTVNSNSSTPGAVGTVDSSSSAGYSLVNSDASLSVEIGIDVPARHLAIIQARASTFLKIIMTRRFELSQILCTRQTIIIRRQQSQLSMPLRAPLTAFGMTMVEGS